MRDCSIRVSRSLSYKMCQVAIPWCPFFQFFTYFSSILLFAFTNVVFEKFCRQNRRIPTGTEVLRSLAIKEDFSWIVNYKRETLKPSSALLKDIPTSLNSGIGWIAVRY